jgi:hypothetical protein
MWLTKLVLLLLTTAIYCEDDTGINVPTDSFTIDLGTANSSMI